MTGAGTIRARLALRGWPVASAPGRMLAYFFVGETVTFVWVFRSLVNLHPTVHSMGLLGLLTVMAVAFEEGVRRAARLEMRLSSDLKRDMTSVWTVAAAVALRPGSAVLLVGAVSVYVCFRQHRPAGRPLYRILYNISNFVLGTLCAGWVVHHFAYVWANLPWALSGAVAVLVAIVVYTVVNRGLVSAALMMVGATIKDLRGTRDENLIELATLCLGGLVALAALHEPWLCILVLAPMVSLQRGALVRELETAATIDGKTGLLNAVAWEHLVSREIAHAQRDEKPLAVLIIDIDRFKLVNDRFGHIAGDKVLREVARRLGAEVREYDTVGRFGGEEFVAVLPSASEVEALIVAERIRSRINELRVSSLIDGVEPRVDDTMAVSIGVACMPIDGTEVSDLLMAADGALYQAKANGRNRVVLAQRGGGNSFAPALGA